MKKIILLVAILLCASVAFLFFNTAAAGILFGFVNPDTSYQSGANKNISFHSEISPLPDRSLKCVTSNQGRISTSTISAANNWIISQTGKDWFSENVILQYNFAECWNGTTYKNAGGKNWYRLYYGYFVQTDFGRIPGGTEKVVIDEDGKILSETTPVPTCAKSDASTTCKITISMKDAETIAHNNNFPAKRVVDLTYRLSEDPNMGPGWVWYLNGAASGKSCSLIYLMEINANTGKAKVVHNGSVDCTRL